jgi:gliding motility-associated-like protein
MSKLEVIILFLFAFATQVVAQNTAHLCVGNNRNFIVPNNPTSLAYNWQVSDPTLATIDSGNGTHHILIDLNNTGVFKLLVEEIDANGCKGYDSILVQIHDLPQPNIFASGPISFCEGDSVLLQVDSIYSAFLWNNNSTSIYLYADTTANYFVNVTDTIGCSNRSNIISIDVHPNPEADFIVDGICVNMPSMLVSTSTISSDNIVSSIWHFENGEVVNGDSLLRTYNFVGDYFTELFVTSNYGCIDSIGKFYSIYNNPIASFEYTPFTVSTLQPEMNFITNSANYNSFLWDFGDSIYSYISSPMHEFESSGTYDVWLTVVDSNQCVDSVMHRITMYYDFVFYMPSAFTPNDDGDNDEFGPQGLRMEKYESYSFYIYNQWGEIIFETEDIKECWDGSDSQHGSYAWVIVIVDELGAKRKKVGNILLIK